MALREIIKYPDKRLNEIAKPVTVFDKELEILVEDMAETMYSAPGIGLAAPQVGINKRLFVVDASPRGEKADLRIFVNPQITYKSGKVLGEEGCLSFPEIYEDVVRAEIIKIQAQNVKGEPFELEASDILAVVIQHEYDHLDGVLLINHLNIIRKKLVDRKMKQWHKKKSNAKPSK